jgi:hypothetical protein
VAFLQEYSNAMVRETRTMAATFCGFQLPFLTKLPCQGLIFTKNITQKSSFCGISQFLGDVTFALP